MIPEQIAQSKKAVIDSLYKHGGVVSDACKALNFNRRTFYIWLNNDPDFKAAVIEARELKIDHVEGKLFELIDGVQVQKEGADGPVVYQQPPNVTAIIFYLKTIGKSRGYVERTELSNPDGSNLMPKSIEITVKGSRSPLLKRLQERYDNAEEIQEE